MIATPPDPHAAGPAADGRDATQEGSRDAFPERPRTAPHAETDTAARAAPPVVAPPTSPSMPPSASLAGRRIDDSSTDARAETRADPRADARPEGRADHPAASPTFSPLYRQIKALITQSLEAGEWRPGDMISSEIELATRYRVSQGTVRKAIDELAAENLLLRRQGRGTFVATHHEDRVQFRFLRLLPDDGEMRPHVSDVLECRRVRSPAEIARQLDVPTGTPVVRIKRVLLFEARATVFEEIWLPGEAFRGLTTERLAGYKGPFYALLETEFGTRLVRASEKVRAVAARPQVAEVLGVDAGAPLLSVERIAYSYGDRPVEVRRGWYVTAHYHYQNDLN